ncbi:MAG: CopD family protein [Rhodobacteraceae bacterium]|nr:CopD family protein [Paracoccaceae bacterium]
MIALLKALHIASFSIWMAGLVLLPVLMEAYGRRAEMRTQEGFDEFRWLTHYSYTRVITPSSVVAIAAGTILIFAQAVMEIWMVAKLVAVSGLVLVHAWLGHVIVQAGEGRGLFRLPPVGLTLVPVLPLIGLVLWLVLAKPDLEPLLAALPAAIQQPRGSELPAILDPL